MPTGPGSTHGISVPCCRPTGFDPYHGKVVTVSAFTKGPWEITEEPWHGRGVQLLVGSRQVPNRTQIAHIKGLYVDPKNIERRANALLIASAPQLYGVLSALVEAIMEGAPEDDVYLIAKHSGRTTLAKARGEPAPGLVEAVALHRASTAAASAIEARQGGRDS